MNREVWKGFAGLCAIAMCAAWAGPAVAQTSEIKEKPPMYTYIAEWNIPRAEWADMEKANASDQKILDKAIAEGTIVGYGNDSAVVHQADGATHDDWWSAMSMAGVLNVLDQLEKSGSTGSPVLASATSHWDSIYVSRYYNWHPWIVEGCVHLYRVLQIKAGSSRRRGGYAEQEPDCAVAGETDRRRHASRVRS